MMLSIAKLQIQQQCSLIGWLNWSTSWSVHLEPWMMEKLQIVGLSYDENQHHFTSLIVLCVNVLSLYYHVMILLMYCRITHEASGDTAEVKVYSVFCLFVFGQCHGWWNAKCTVYVCKAVTDRFDWRQTFVEAPLPSLCRLTLSLHPSQPDLNTLITVSFLFKVFWMLIESIFYLSSV